jgi:hypothetical protein
MCLVVLCCVLLGPLNIIFHTSPITSIVNSFKLWYLQISKHSSQHTVFDVVFRVPQLKFCRFNLSFQYRGAGKSLALPGRKKATATDFDLTFM